MAETWEVFIRKKKKKYYLNKDYVLRHNTSPLRLLFLCSDYSSNSCFICENTVTSYFGFNTARNTNPAFVGEYFVFGLAKIAAWNLWSWILMNLVVNDNCLIFYSYILLGSFKQQLA